MHKFVLSVKSDVLKLDAAQELKLFPSCKQRPGIISKVFLQWLVYIGGYCDALYPCQHILILIQMAKMVSYHSSLMIQLLFYFTPKALQ